MAKWDHRLPDFYAAIDVHEQVNPFGEPVARDPDDLQVGQSLYMGYGWVRIHSLEKDRWDQVLIQEPHKYPRRVDPRQLRRAAEFHRKVAELREKLGQEVIVCSPSMADHIRGIVEEEVAGHLFRIRVSEHCPEDKIFVFNQKEHQCEHATT